MKIKVCVFVLSLFLFSGCFAQQDADKNGDPNNAERNKGLSATIASFFEPSEAEKAKAAEMKARQRKLQEEAQEMQRERLNTY